MYTHIPVLLNEVLSYSKLRAGKDALDATLGGGGYTKELLKKISPKGKVLAFDADKDAIENAREEFVSYITSGRLLLKQTNFSQVGKICQKLKFVPHFIVADLGLSSHELEESGRGFSFQKDEPLDMRFGTDLQTLTAAEVLQTYEEHSLVRIFQEFGEEKFAKVIARNIVRKRLKAPLKRTAQLAVLIADSIPVKNPALIRDSVRRIFQAVRMEVNGELESLHSFLQGAVQVLAPKGVLAVVSFHSLEDRIVKNQFRSWSIDCICPPESPVCRCENPSLGIVVTKKPVSPQISEQRQNPRSKSAKLRVFQKK